MAKIKRICSIPGCDKPHIAKGWCIEHYNRCRRTGDPLTPSPTAEPRRFLAEVVLQYRGAGCLPWPYGRNKEGYGRITIEDGRSVAVHRVVCERAHGPAPLPELQAAHSCGKGHLGCVNPMHLSWKTAKENSADRFIHGTDSRGERNNLNKLSPDDIRTIRASRDTQANLATQFGVAQPTISQIVHRKRWGWLE